MGVSPEHPEHDERRGRTRVSGDWLQCDLGEIIDVSGTGVLLKCTRRLRGNVALRLWNYEVGLVMQARVIWSNPVCFRHHEVGLKFQKVGTKNQETLNDLVYPLGEDSYTDVGIEEAEVGETLSLADDESGDSSANPLLDEFPSSDGATCIDDDSLREVVDAWPHLPEALQTAIVRLVQSPPAA